jgi:23S rRNA (guanosine2251-2'-O)-methyltransferase
MGWMAEIIVIAHNIRSTHNIGAIFRTSDGFGVSKIILSGYSPYPATQNDSRLPHLREKITRDIHKTALGAETSVPFEYSLDLESTLRRLKTDGWHIVALEQTPDSIELPRYTPTGKIALLLGEEVHGIEKQWLEMCDYTLEIPMKGHKESFNVSVATGITLYHLFFP